MIQESHLRKIHLFRELESAELARLIPVLKERHAPKGSYIVYVDDPGPSIMFILEGKVKITLVSSEGKEIVLAHLGEGDFFGEIALLTGEDRSANVVASTDCTVLILASDDFKKHILERSGLALNLMRELALRLRAASAKIGDLALYDVFERVFRQLRSLAKPDPKTGVETIDDRPTHQEISSMVGTSREMVSRALKNMEEDETIRVSGKRIEILRTEW